MASVFTQRQPRGSRARHGRRDVLAPRARAAPLGLPHRRRAAPATAAPPPPPPRRPRHRRAAPATAAPPPPSPRRPRRRRAASAGAAPVTAAAPVAIASAPSSHYGALLACRTGGGRPATCSPRRPPSPGRPLPGRSPPPPRRPSPGRPPPPTSGAPTTTHVRGIHHHPPTPGVPFSEARRLPRCWSWQWPPRGSNPWGYTMARSGLRCGFLSNPPVFVEGIDDSFIMLPSSLYNVAVVPADVLPVSDGEEDLGDVGGRLGSDGGGGAVEGGSSNRGHNESAAGRGADGGGNTVAVVAPTPVEMRASVGRMPQRFLPALAAGQWPPLLGPRPLPPRGRCRRHER
ncbi:hypothetical protein BU14_0048s0017 [Porphyra umbilicalis]|uniref:Uncharacterized protein n=1 Tax=Porphyra umbilicalis TaxID=2786 RepID=A0A1X6PIA9_PORUM|nr:hypothetical protein BU14_0048s0017 [Porphyra umbilicalis]|eukprot:OSX80602.1 hypothetical protein BU14_0048s0017 [Porphyra umbilicalis]